MLPPASVDAFEPPEAFWLELETPFEPVFMALPGTAKDGISGTIFTTGALVADEPPEGETEPEPEAAPEPGTDPEPATSPEIEPDPDDAPEPAAAPELPLPLEASPTVLPAPLEMGPWPPDVPALAPLPTLPEFAVSPEVEPALPALSFPPFDEVPPFDSTLPFEGTLPDAEP